MSSFRWPARRLVRAFLLPAAVILPAGQPSQAAPHVPPSDVTVLERLPSTTGVVAAELRRLRSAAADHADLATAMTAAERFLALGRTTQDPRYIGYASGALQPWWEEPGPSAEFLVLRAAIRQHRHDFAGALTDLDRALRQDPGNSRAWLSRSTILLVQGRPAAALAACAKLERSSASMAGTVCRAAAMGRLGQAAAGFALLDTTLARSAGLAPELERWARIELAELARLDGRADIAETQLRAALQLEPQDAFAANALADLLLEKGQPREALDVVAGDLGHDGKLLRATLAARRLDAPEWRAQAALMRERFDAARQRGDALHLREEARFRLEIEEEPVPALALARENWRAQREPADARLLLRSAVMAGAPDAAEPVLAWLRETGFRDPEIAAVVNRLEGADG